VPYPYPSAFQTTIEMMNRMVVDPSSALTPVVRSLTGQQISQDIVDYDLADKGLAAAGGIGSFGVSGPDPLKRTEEYDVRLKPAENQK
jgi:hypothetical protein